jgi:N4-gp56 family major capsid protein
MATNTTISTAATTYLNKTYYDRNLLENAKTKFIHADYGQKRHIPKNNGKKVEFRRWTLFDPSLVTPGLTEGVTPEGQDLAQTHVEATVKQYGAYVEVSDLLKTSSYDDVMEGATDMLGEQVGTAIEWITRDEMCSGTSVQYAGTNVARKTIASTDVLTTGEIRKAVRTLKKHKAKMFNRHGGRDHFIAIVSPDTTYDLQSDTVWQDVSKYSNAEQIYSGEIGRIFSVVVVESTEAKVFKQAVLNKVNANTSSSADFVLKNDPTDEEVAYLSTGGNKIKIGSTEYTLASSGSYTAATKTVKLSASASLSADAIVYSEDAGAVDATTKEGTDVQATLIFGRDAYGTIDIEGMGNLHTIIKAPGSAGTADPLDQRCTVAAKVDAYTAKILNNDWIVRVEHGATA